MAIIFSSYIYTEATAGVTPQKVSSNANTKTGKWKEFKANGNRKR